MTGAAKKLIESFAALPETEQEEVLSELLHRYIGHPYAALSEDDYTQAADRVFQELDRDEARG